MIILTGFPLDNAHSWFSNVSTLNRFSRSAIYDYFVLYLHSEVYFFLEHFKEKSKKRGLISGIHLCLIAVVIYDWMFMIMFFHTSRFVIDGICLLWQSRTNGCWYVWHLWLMMYSARVFFILKNYRFLL